MRREQQQLQEPVWVWGALFTTPREEKAVQIWETFTIRKTPDESGLPTSGRGWAVRGVEAVVLLQHADEEMRELRVRRMSRKRKQILKQRRMWSSLLTSGSARYRIFQLQRFRIGTELFSTSSCKNWKTFLFHISILSYLLSSLLTGS